MATNGEGKVVELLEKILKVQESMDTRLERVEAHLGSVEARLGSVEAELKGVNNRLDLVLKIAGEHHRELDRRLTMVEQRLDRLGTTG
jgi:hypothetical protein